MDRIKIISSNIDLVGYDETAKLLEITFLNGHVYEYLNVDKKTYLEFMKASSKGTFLNTIIIKKYTAQKIK
jgi:lysyl-tRNA synthetase class 2